MARSSSLVKALLPLILSILALVFSLLATTSREWAIRRTYDPLALQADWDIPIFTKYRSPFIICNPSSGSDAATADLNSTLPINVTFTQNCVRFRALGFNKTSCELAVATKSDGVATLGDARLCQQIHFAGNLAIASTVFIGLGFLLVFGMTLLSLSSIKGNTPISKSTVTEDTTGETAPPANPHARVYNHRFSQHTPYVNLTLVFFLVLGAALYVLAQFYGVLGLVQSAPDNGSFATFSGNNPDPRGNDHEPWIQGKALTIYASTAWFASLLAAAAAIMAWRLPRGEKIF